MSLPYWIVISGLKKYEEPIFCDLQSLNYDLESERYF